MAKKIKKNIVVVTSEEAKSVATNEFINAACGLILVEVKYSNPNGDPDCGGEPRLTPAGDIGLMSDVSNKRKFRNLILDKEGPVYQEISKEFNLDVNNFDIFEARDRDFKKLAKEKTEDILNRHWDCRVFGTTLLSKEGSHVNSGAVQFGLGTSVAPVKLLSFTHTKCAGAEAGKNQGMAPKGYKVVEHGLYCIPFYINPTSARKSRCTQTDIDVFKRLLPFIFTHSISRSRTEVSIHKAWFIDLGSPTGRFNPVAIVNSLYPTKKDPNTPSKSIADYDIPSDIPEEAKKRGLVLRNLV